MSTGLILFAHGARSPAWGKTLEDLAAALRRRDASLRVELAFLELQPPDFAQAAAALAGAGVTQVRVLPVFWARAGHVDNDLPPLIAAARAAHPQLAFEVLPVLSELPGLIDFVAARALGR
jgi:sirohydrochlorin cobaltochelatase